MIQTTIIIPNLNGMKYLEACIASIRMQRKENWKLIIVDNASNDGSYEWILKNCPMAEVISFSENKGFCSAVNAGIKKADTKYVLLLNNDTVIHPDFVEELEKVMEKHPKAFSVAAQMLEMANPKLLDGAGDYYSALGWAFARGKGKTAVSFPKETEIFSACAGAALYRREIFEEIGYFDETHFAYLEDMDIGYRAQIAGYKSYYAPMARVEHAGSGSSGSRYNKFKIELSSRNNIYLIYKNMPFMQILLNLPLLIAGFLIKQIFFIKKGYGMTYLKGIKSGFALCCSKNGRTHKVKFKKQNFKYYIKIQIELWINIFRRI